MKTTRRNGKRTAAVRRKNGRHATAVQPANGAAVILPKHARTRQGKARLLSLSDLDMQRASYKEARSLMDSLVADKGGKDQITSAELTLIERAGLLRAMTRDFETRWAAGERLPWGEYLAATNTLRRVLVSLGLERRAKSVNSLTAVLDDDWRQRQRQQQVTNASDSDNSGRTS